MKSGPSFIRRSAGGLGYIVSNIQHPLVHRITITIVIFISQNVIVIVFNAKKQKFYQK